MRTLAASPALLLAVWLGTPSAFAADMRGTYAPAPAVESITYPVTTSDSGFYLRGDLGYSANRANNILFSPPLPTERTLSHRNGASGLVGIGAGYQVNALLRGDISAEYRSSSRFRFLNREENSAAPLNYYANDAHGQLSTKLVLANAYVNLFTWNRITPFVGVGVGLASISMKNFSSTGVGPGNMNAPGNIIGGIANDVTRTRPALALHAGVSYDLGANWQAELGYRYVNMGNLKGNVMNCWGYLANAAGSYSTTNCQPAHHPTIKTLGAHDLKFGLRYMFAATPAKPIITEQPGYIRR